MKNNITSIVVIVSIFLFILTFSGCAVVKATKQPGKKDLSVLDKGTQRSHVIAELGTPLHSGEKNGEKFDVFAFTQGYSKGAKTGRALFHGVADVATFGLWEIVANPIETIASGTEVKVQVIYDKDDKVKEVLVLKGQEKVKEIKSVE